MDNEYETKTDEQPEHCRTCGMRVRVVGHTTKHYEPVIAPTLDLAQFRDWRMSAKPGLTEGFFTAEFMPYLAECLVGWFQEAGGVNYVENTYLELDVNHKETGKLTLTLQRVQGKTPDEMRQEAEAERDALKAERDYMLLLLASHLASARGDEAESDRLCDSPEADRNGWALDQDALQRSKRFSADLYALAEAGQAERDALLAELGKLQQIERERYASATRTLGVVPPSERKP